MNGNDIQYFYRLTTMLGLVSVVLIILVLVVSTVKYIESMNGVRTRQVIVEQVSKEPNQVSQLGSKNDSLYCEKDSDCVMQTMSCDCTCPKAVNKDSIEITECDEPIVCDIICQEQYVVCRNFKCVAINDNNEVICPNNQIPYGTWIKKTFLDGTARENFRFQKCIERPADGFEGCEKIWEFPYETGGTSISKECICISPDCPV